MKKEQGTQQERPDVESEEESDEDAGNDNVAETEHGKVVGSEAVDQQVLREHHCDDRTVLSELASK